MTPGSLPWWTLFEAACAEGNVAPDRVPWRVVTLAIRGYLCGAMDLPVRVRSDEHSPRLVLTLRGGRPLASGAEVEKARDAIGAGCDPVMWCSSYGYMMIAPWATTLPDPHDEAPRVPILVPERFQALARTCIIARLRAAFPAHYPKPRRSTTAERTKAWARRWLATNQTDLRRVERALGREAILEQLVTR